MFPEGRILDLVIVGVVALIVVGPKDLPILMRKVGQFVAKMRAMAAEFRASFDEMARQSELDELRAEVAALRSSRPLDHVVGAGEIRRAFAEIGETLKGHGLGASVTPLHPPLDAALAAPEYVAPALMAPSVEPELAAAPVEPVSAVAAAEATPHVEGAKPVRRARKPRSGAGSAAKSRQRSQ